MFDGSPAKTVALPNIPIPTAADDTQEYDPTKWTFGAVVKEPVTAFYLAKVE